MEPSGQDCGGPQSVSKSTKLTTEQLYEEIKLRGPKTGSIWEDDFNPNYFLSDTLRRKPFVFNYSWAIPSKEAIQEIARFIGSDKCLEVGAGKGLWAFLLSEAGASMTATDDYTEHTTAAFDSEIRMWQDSFDARQQDISGQTGSTEPSLSIEVKGACGSQGCAGLLPENLDEVDKDEIPFLVKVGLSKSDFEILDRTYFNVEKLDYQEAITKYPDHNCLMICWGRINPYSSFKGNKIVFIGEDKGGCTTPPPDEEEWELIKEVKIKRWTGMKDFLGLYQRKIKP